MCPHQALHSAPLTHSELGTSKDRLLPRPSSMLALSPIDSSPSQAGWGGHSSSPSLLLSPALVLLPKAHKLMVEMTCYTYGHVFSDRKGHCVSYTEINVNNPSMLERLWSSASRLVMFSGRKRVLCFPHRKQGEPSLLQYFKTERAVTQRSEQPGCPRSPARLTTGLFSPFQHLKNIVPHFYFSKKM